MRRITRRNKERTWTRRKRSTIQVNLQSPDRTKQQLIRQGANKVTHRANMKRSRKRVGSRLRLCAELGKIGKENIPTRKGNTRRYSLKLPNATSSGKGDKEKDLAGEILRTAGGKRLKRRTPKESEYPQQVPRRNPRRKGTFKNGRKRSITRESSRGGRPTNAMRPDRSGPRRRRRRKRR